MSKMFDEFTNKYLGKKVDVDGQYGGQCVDLFNAWNRDYNGTYINCSPSGYARSIAENKENNGILKYYKETAVNNMITGTVVVYGKCKFAPDSHVCFFIEDNGNGTYKALQQNDKGRQYVTIDNNSYEGIIGAFIPFQILDERYPAEEPEENKNDEEIERLNKIIEEKNQNISNLENQLSKTKKQIESKTNVINELKAQIETLSSELVEQDEKIENYPKSIFKCKKTGKYKIKLYENEELFIK